jgi:putative hydrolase of the HAD superfamily
LCDAGFPEVLQALPSKLVTGVVSNAQFYTPLIMEVLARQTLTQLGFRPDRCAWSYQCGVAKPSPRLLQSVLTQTGVPPDQVVVVGNDLLKDVARCRTVLFAGDLRSLRANPVELRDPSARPDAIITELRQLPGLL